MGDVNLSVSASDGLMARVSGSVRVFVSGDVRVFASGDVRVSVKVSVRVRVSGDWREHTNDAKVRVNVLHSTPSEKVRVSELVKVYARVRAKKHR